MRARPLFALLLSLAAPAAAAPKVLLLGADTSTAPATLKAYLAGTNLFDKVDVLEASTVLPDLATLKGYEAVVTWSYQKYKDPTALGNLLADYVDAGGGVVQAMFAMYTGWELLGRWKTESYNCINAAQFAASPALKAQANDPNNPIIMDVKALTTQYHSPGGLVMGATSVWDYTNNQPAIATCRPKGHARADLNFNPNSGANTTTGDWQPAVRNAIAFVAGGFNPVKGLPNPVAFPDTGTGATSAPITVTFTNTGMAQQNVQKVELAGPQANEFALSGVPGLPLSLAVGATFPVNVAFAPLGAGARSAQLKVTIAGQQSTGDVTLAGKGIGPNLTITPNPVAVGGTQIGVAIQKDVTVANLGGGKVSVLNGTVTMGQADFSLQNAPMFPVSLGGGASFTLRVVFKPTMNGASSGVLTFTTNDANAPTINLPLTGYAGPPMISLDAGSIAFGNVNLKAKSQEQVVTITNRGFSDLVVSNLALGGAQPADFLLDKKMAVARLPPNGSQAFGVTFAPTALGQRQATITITSNDANAPNKTVSVLGTGTSATIAVMPMALAFGNNKVQMKSMVQNLTLSNSGSGTLKVMAISFAGNHPTAFGQGGGPLPPFTVAAMSNLLAGVYCQPNMIGPLSATMTITTDVGAAAVNLTCTGVSPKLALTPNVIDFPPTPLGGKSKPEKVTLQNVGTDDLTVNAVSVDGPGFDSMDLPMMALTLGAGKSASFNVTYEPPGDMVGMDMGTITIQSDDPLLKQAVIKLTASSFQAGVSVTPMVLDFGGVLAGVSAPPKPVTITNTGGAPLSIDKIVSSNPGTFPVDTMGPLLIAPKQSASISVAFQPLTGGPQTGKLTLSPAGLMPISVDLKGSGLQPSLTVSTMAIDFGPIAVGTSSEAVPIGLKNGGNTPLTIASITSSDPLFAVDTSGTALTLSAGGVTSFAVRFTPLAGVTSNARIAVLLKGQAQPTTVISATGSGVVPIVRPPRGCSVARSAPAGGAFGMAAAVSLLALLLLRRRRGA